MFIDKFFNINFVLILCIDLKNNLLNSVNKFIIQEVNMLYEFKRYICFFFFKVKVFMRENIRQKFFVLK